MNGRGRGEHAMQLNEKNKNSIAQLKDTLGFSSSTGYDAVRSKKRLQTRIYPLHSPSGISPQGG